jgi:hypothetical protein
LIGFIEVSSLSEKYQKKITAKHDEFAALFPLTALVYRDEVFTLIAVSAARRTLVWASWFVPPTDRADRRVERRGTVTAVQR